MGTDAGDVQTLIGDGTGSFSILRPITSSVPLAVMDLNGDGYEDTSTIGQETHGEPALPPWLKEGSPSGCVATSLADLG